MDSEPSKKVKQQVEELDAANKCLRCKKQCQPGSDPPDGRWRGLCLGKGGCFHKYDAPRRRMNDDQRAEYDSKAQKAGLVLEANPGRRLNDSEFTDLAEEVKS